MLIAAKEYSNDITKHWWVARVFCEKCGVLPKDRTLRFNHSLHDRPSSVYEINTNYWNMFDTIQAAPPDPILGLTDAFNTDNRESKINLGIGVYKNEAGQTPTLAAVRTAETQLLSADLPKGYLPITGSPLYGQLSRELLFGSGHDLVTSGRAVTAHTPGGTGGLRVAGDFMAGQAPGSKLWISTPTWANHPSIFSAAGIETASYRYYDATKHGLDATGMLEDLDAIAAGDVVLLHGCCHNPTGVDLDLDQWKHVAELLAARKAVPLIDFAYQGFGADLEQDAAGLRALADLCPEFIVCASYSKNFGLYNERVGATTFVCPDASTAKNVASQLKVVIRRNYSNPPAHGGKIVETILSDATLTAQWQSELAAMRDRINSVRVELATALDSAGLALSAQGNSFLTHQNGMFGFSGLSKDEVATLRKDHAVYMVASGRINVAGITPANIDHLVSAIAAVRA